MVGREWFGDVMATRMIVPGTQSVVYTDDWILSEFGKSLTTSRFQIYLQPQVDVSGRIIGAEVLSRWFDQDGNMIPVDQFLSVVCRSELIAQMDKHVWELTAELLHSWKGTPMEELYLSVNVEPKDFIYMNVPETLHSVCERYGVSVGRVHVEITERGFSSDLFSPELFIDLLHKDGVMVEIDDFGKGSSSLALLKDFDVDILKLDMAFIQDSGHEQRKRIVLESIVDMARKLKTCVIAEGVETPHQWEIVRDVGCDCYQGFLFSKPLPVKEFEIFYQDHNKHRLC